VSHYLKMSLFLLSGFGCIKASDERSEEYKRYFKLQEKIYQSLESLGIAGARPLNLNEVLAESVLANCPKEVDEIISDFEHSVFSTSKKNIIFHGPSGTGKSVLAQAIAIRCKVPCLFFNVGTISTEYKDSGVQNLNKIFKYAQELEKSLGQPCIVIFDELEALTKKHIGTNHAENNILISFWQELDKLANSKVIAIGTMNSTEDVPDQIINRTSMIEVPLPNLKQTEAILSYHLKKRQNKYNLAYSEWLTPAYLARQTKGFCNRFCNRDLENVVEQATRPVIKLPVPLDGSSKIVSSDNFDRVIKQIKKNSREKWKHTFKKHLRDPKITLPLAGMAVMLGLGYKNFSNQEKSIAVQVANHKENVANHKENIALQKANQAENIVHQKEIMALQVAHQRESMAQAKQIADYQTSFEHMGKQAKINSIDWKDYSATWKDNFSNEEIVLDSEWLSLNLFGFGFKNKVLKNAK
jgi:SpoVK/Ycf46/Vps4 family AAA+-type ATPase